MKRILLVFICFLVVWGGVASAGTISLPGRINTIYEETFMNDTSLYSVNIPIGVKRVENRAFAYSGVRCVSIPSSVTYISNNAFTGCNNLILILRANSSAETAASNAGIPYFRDTEIIENDGFYYQNIGSGVRLLGAIDNQKVSTSVTIPEMVGGYRVTEISPTAFYRCSRINTIYLPGDAQCVVSDASLCSGATVTRYGASANSGQSTGIQPTGIQLYVDEYELEVGNSEYVRVVLSPEGASSKITFTGGKTDYLSVDQNGLVTALKKGSTYTITATTENGLSATVSVRPVIKLQKFRFAQDTYATNTSYNHLYIYLEYEPKNATAMYRNFTFTSSNPSVATIGSYNNSEDAGDKRLDIQGAGSTVITVENEAGQKAYCSVTVGYPQLDPPEVYRIQNRKNGYPSIYFSQVGYDGGYELEEGERVDYNIYAIQYDEADDNDYVLWDWTYSTDETDSGIIFDFDSHLPKNIPYYFYIEAVKDGYISSVSPTYTVTRLDANSEETPSSLSTPQVVECVSTSDTTALLRWNRVSGASKYIVYYGENSNNLNLQVSRTFSGNNNTEYVDFSNFSKDHTYYFRVQATASGKTSALSDIVSCRTGVNSQPSSISVNAATLKVGEKKVLSATVYPGSAVNTLSWSSSDTSVLKFDENGNAQALKAGSVTVTATSIAVSSVYGTATITVESVDSGTPTPAFSIGRIVSQTVEEGEMANFTIAPIGGTGNYSYEWYKASNTTETGTKVSSDQSYGVISEEELNNTYYYCKVSDGNQTKTSERAKLTVEPEPLQFSVEHPNLSGNVLTMDENAGINAYCTLTVTSNKAWTASIPGNNFIKIVQAEGDNVVTINSTTSASGSYSGKFRVQIVNVPAAGKTLTETVTFNVNGQTRQYQVKFTRPSQVDTTAPSLALKHKNEYYSGSDYTRYSSDDADYNRYGKDDVANRLDARIPNNGSYSLWLTFVISNTTKIKLDVKTLTGKSKPCFVTTYDKSQGNTSPVYTKTWTTDRTASSYDVELVFPETTEPGLYIAEATPYNGSVAGSPVLFSFRVRLADNKTLENSTLNAKFQEMQNAGLKTGKYWNRNPKGTVTTVNLGITKTYVSTYRDNSSDYACGYIGWQCFGFGHLVADYIGSQRIKIGGDGRTTNWDGYGHIAFTDAELNAIERLKPGDWVRYKTSYRHTIVVMKVQGDTITLVDCNYYATNKEHPELEDKNIIQWGRTMSKEKLLEKFYYTEKFSLDSDYE